MRLLAAGLPLLVVTVIYAASPRLRAGACEAIADAFTYTFFSAIDDPGPVRARMIEAADLMWRDRWPEARDIYEQLAREHPDDSEVWYGLALCLHHLGDYDDAIGANLHALGSKRYAADAYFQLAGEFAVTGRIDGALEYLDRAFELGFRNLKKIADDPALAPLRSDPRFHLPRVPEIRTFTFSDGTIVKYALVLPRDFDPNRTYPALLGFSRSRQDMDAANFALDNYWGLQASCHDWIVVSPLAISRDGYAYSDDYLRIPELLDHIQSQYHIEGGRFHLAGFSNGGSTCFRIATAFPRRFQSVTAFPCYAIADRIFARLDRLHGTPVYLFYGGDDGGPSVEASNRIQRRLVELGIRSTLTVFAGERHEITSLMGDRLMHHLDSLRVPFPDLPTPVL